MCLTGAGGAMRRVSGGGGGDGGGGERRGGEGWEAWDCLGISEHRCTQTPGGRAQAHIWTAPATSGRTTGG